MDKAIKIAQIIITISQGVILTANEKDALSYLLKDEFVNQSGKKGCSCRMNFKTALIDWTICLHYKGKIFCVNAYFNHRTPHLGFGID